MPGNDTYKRYKQENKELREKLALYESGTFGIDIEDQVIKVPQSLERILRRVMRGHNPDDIWVYYYEEILEKIQSVNVTFQFESASVENTMNWLEWEGMLKIGDGDPAKALDVIGMKYLAEMRRREKNYEEEL